MKKLKVFILILTALSLMTVATGCGSDESNIDIDSTVKVTFMLEGGSFQNSQAPLVYGYDFKGDGKEHLIRDPAAEEESERFSRSIVKRAEYTFDGWYRTRAEVDGHIVYSDKWDFANDKIGDDNITLYAKWVRLLHYTYQMYYVDEESGELVKIGVPYDVEEGEKFNDLFRQANTREGYTAEGFYDEDGNPWNSDFVHPGGEVSTEIKVIVKYSKGQYVEVATAQQLIANYNKDIRLVADIDFGGEDFGGFRDYKHLFDGQGHTVKNFKLTYNDTNDALDWDEDLGDDGNILNISLFGKTENAEVRDVKFEGVNIDLDTTNRQIKKIIVAPLCVKATDSVFENVSVSATYTKTRLPRGYKGELAVVGNEEDKHGCYFDDGSTFTEVKIAVDNQITL